MFALIGPFGLRALIQPIVPTLRLITTYNTHTHTHTHTQTHKHRETCRHAYELNEFRLDSDQARNENNIGSDGIKSNNEKQGDPLS